MTKHISRGKSDLSIISFRVSDEEKQLYQIAAKDTSLSTFIRTAVMKYIEENTREIKQSRLSPHTKQKLLAQILSAFGKFDLAKAFSDLSYAAKIGVLPLTPDVLNEIQMACRYIKEIRNLLLKALGLKPKD